MKAKVIAQFDGRPDNAAKVVSFKVGDFVIGDLAKVAVAQGWAEEIAEEESTEADTKPRSKSRRKR